MGNLCAKQAVAQPAKAEDTKLQNYQIVPREWVKNTHSQSAAAAGKEKLALKVMHWNILAQRLADGFDKIPDDSPILYYKNRLSLWK